MQSTIIALTGFKGGCGKSTLTIHLAGCFQQMGLSVLIVDADEQGSLLSFAQVAVPGFPTVVGIDKPILHKENQVPALAADRNITLIDCPPKDNQVIVSALTIADIALVPVTPSPLDIWSALAFKKLLERAQAERPDLSIFLVVSRRQPNTTIGEEGKQALARYNLEVLDTEIFQRIDTQTALLEGMPITSYKPKSKAAKEFSTLASEVIDYAQAQAQANARRPGR